MIRKTGMSAWRGWSVRTWAAAFASSAHWLGMSQQEFADAYGIRVANLRQYEMARHMRPPAVRAYLKVIEAEPEMVRRVIAG